MTNSQKEFEEFCFRKYGDPMPEWDGSGYTNAADLYGWNAWQACNAMWEAKLNEEKIAEIISREFMGVVPTNRELARAIIDYLRRE